MNGACILSSDEAFIGFIGQLFARWDRWDNAKDLRQDFAKTGRTIGFVNLL
jgi:hypothetical protein